MAEDEEVTCARNTAGTRHSSARAQRKSLRGTPRLPPSLPDFPGPARLLSCCACVHTCTHVHTRVRGGGGVGEQSCSSRSDCRQDPGEGSGTWKAPSGRCTEPPSLPQRTLTQLDPWNSEAGPRPGGALSYRTRPAPLLTQSHELTSDSPAGLSGAGNVISSPPEPNGCRQRRGRTVPVSALCLLRGRQ